MMEHFGGLSEEAFKIKEKKLLEKETKQILLQTTTKKYEAAWSGG